MASAVLINGPRSALISGCGGAPTQETSQGTLALNKDFPAHGQRPVATTIRYHWLTMKCIVGRFGGEMTVIRVMVSHSSSHNATNDCGL